MKRGRLLVTVLAALVVRFAAAVTAEEDGLSFDLAETFPEEINCAEDFNAELVVDSLSFPSVTFSGLPKGLSYDAKTLTVYGRPTEPGTYFITATAVNASGYSYTAFAELRVAPPSDGIIPAASEEIELDAYFHARFEELFGSYESVTNVVMTGVPPGLVWHDGWQLLYGTPTTPGEYTVSVEASLSTGGAVRTWLMLTVTVPEPESYGFDFSALDVVQVGDVFEPDASEIFVEDWDVVLSDISGLPPGLTCVKWRDDEVWHWGLSGTLSKPGRYRIWASVIDDGGVTSRVVRTSRFVTVCDTPQVYLKVLSEDDSRGTVSGGGAVTPGLPVAISAMPRAGQVFAGWYDENGERMVFENGTDYRTPRLTLPADTDYSLMSLCGRFVPSQEDVAPDLSELDGSVFVVAPDALFETVFAVSSQSLPTLQFKGLPAGFSCTSVGTGEYVLSYDPETASREPKSGRYAVVLTVKNKSGEKVTAKFLITMPNEADARVKVLDDYGEFMPGEAIDAISLADAVDFSRGETLSVSGLPRGLIYNDKANAKKGIEAKSVTGTPTVPGDYTLTFRAKVVSGVTTNARGKVSVAYETVTVTSFLTVLPYPELVVEVDEEAAEAGCRVSGGGNYKAGTKVTVKAVAAAGWVFAGWFGLDDDSDLSAFAPQQTIVTGEDDSFLYAGFIRIGEDYLSIDDIVDDEGGNAVFFDLNTSVDELDEARTIADLIWTGSYPKVKVSGLPAGLKFSSSTFLLSGKPTKSGVFWVTVSATNASGYSFTRVLRFVVRTASGEEPEAPTEENAAEIDFSPLEGLQTGVLYEARDVVLVVGPHPASGSAVKRVSVSGLPAGLKATTVVADDGATVSLSGTPSKPGRFTLKITVSYQNGKTARSQSSFVVADGGSYYLSVENLAPECGSVTGGGVYASGQTVKLTARPTAKAVFCGWLTSGDEEESVPFSALARQAVDYRTTSVSFPLRAADFPGADCRLFADFRAKTEDSVIDLAFASDVWELATTADAELPYALSSASLPKLTVKGLPAGVSVDLIGSRLVYAVSPKAVPGEFSVTATVVNQSRAQTEARLTVRVANWTSPVIGGLDPDPQAYALTAGVALSPSAILPVCPSDWKLTVKGLPSGLSYKNGVISGIPTRAGTYTVTFTATRGSGKQKETEVATITVRVADFPKAAVGTYNGFVCDEEDGLVGTWTLTVAQNGKSSASVKIREGSLKFSLPAFDGWDAENRLTETGSLKTATLILTVDLAKAWDEVQVEGLLTTAAGTPLRLTAQRNMFDAKTGSEEAKLLLRPLVGTWKVDQMQIKVSQDGSVKVTGKTDGITLSESAKILYNNGFYFSVVKFTKDKGIRLTADFDSESVSWSCRWEQIP